MSVWEAILLITWVFLLVWGVPIAIAVALIWAAIRFVKRKTAAAAAAYLGPMEGSDGA